MPDFLFSLPFHIEVCIKELSFALTFSHLISFLFMSTPRIKDVQTQTQYKIAISSRFKNEHTDISGGFCVFVMPTKNFREVETSSGGSKSAFKLLIATNLY